MSISGYNCTMQKTYKLIKEKMESSQKNVLCLHRRADGDSLGSNLAFASVLEKLGKEVTIYSIDEVPEYLRFLEGWDKVVIQSPDQIIWHNFDTFWALDMSAADMLGKAVELPEKLEHIVIDHHKTNEGWGKINLVDETSASCTEVLYDLFAALKIQYDATDAMALLTGLATDTGFFKYISSGKSMRIGGELIDTHKLNYQKIIFNIQSQLNIEDVLFLGNALSMITVNYDKKAAILPIPYKSWINFGDAGESNHMLTGYISSINGTEFGVIIIEEKPKMFRARFRSRNRDFDVSALAAHFGGGGHKNAAGATIEAETMDEAIKQILDLYE